MKYQHHKRNAVTVGTMALGAMLIPQTALAQASGQGIGGLMDFLTKLMESGMILVGAALALAGLIALGLGALDIINHFKPENRDQGDGKSRAVSGIVKFIIGGILATGSYQLIANNENFGQASIAQPEEAVVVVFSAPTIAPSVLVTA